MEGERQALSKTTRPLHLEEGAWGGVGRGPCRPTQPLAGPSWTHVNSQAVSTPQAELQNLREKLGNCAE